MAHPLFPCNSDDDDVDIGFIHVVRHEGGNQVWCPHLFGADELTDLDQVHALFGGGNYELVARGTDKGGFVARRRVSLPGAARPLVVDGGAGQVTQSATVSPPVPQAPGDSGLMGVLFQTMATQAQASQQLLLAMLQQQSQMMTAVMARDADASKNHIQTMQQLHDRSMQQHAELMRVMVEASRGNSSSAKELVEVLKEGIDLGRTSKATPDGDEEDGDELTDLVETAAQVMQGLNGTAPPAAPAATPPAGEP